MDTILVLAPHPDDGEFGLGATLHRFAQEGKNVFYAAFSPCIASVPDGFPKDILYKELGDATGKLRIPKENLITFDCAVRNFPAIRQDILESLVKLNRQLKPDLVFMPNSKDLHQDHQVIHNEGLRAFKKTRILGYELPWNDVAFDNRFYIKVTEENLTAKTEAIACYKSQGFRPYTSKSFFRSLAQMRGMQAGEDLAEAFEPIRWKY
ncbi:PIG-L deacetylase family protein [Luteibaculum oceani]|uniref:PIG-L family deacetylase n=1 Tax=Luteibaculum oceani TaxID=1294296 RepID=A0A5C6VD49_9FLAO|nr:PIG-L family deacetylase [Luteibaculum oceani]TXC81535.1 PIG-L family deacetylase [Luteibaculum oceani]